MTASAGIAAVAHEELAAASGEPAGTQAAIVIVCREAAAREMLRLELSKRYAADYEIVVCAQPAELAPWMRDLLAAGLPVALVIAGVGAQDPDGIEVLAGIRDIDPTALRVAAVGWGDWQSVRSIFAAVTVGKIDHWVTRPVQTPAEEFHRSITEFLTEWSGQRGGGFEAVPTVVLSAGAVAGNEYEFVVFNNYTITNAIGPAGGNITGTLLVPTQPVDDTSGKVLNSQWYMNQGSAVAGAAVTAAAGIVGSSYRWARADHTHQITLGAINGALTAANSGFELGSTGTANTPFIDFHSSGNNIDYDVRLMASGGDATSGDGSLTCNATGGFTCTGNVTAYSDERLKKNWKTFDSNIISRLAKVKSGVYERTDADVTQVGVSAQSLREILPEAVQEDDNGTLSVAYGNAALAMCVELAKQVESLKKEIEELKNRKGDWK